MDTYFWEDNCLGDRPICSTFPHLYHTSIMRNDLVTTVLFNSGSTSFLSLGFECYLFDREITEILTVLSLSGEFCICPERRDLHL